MLKLLQCYRPRSIKTVFIANRTHVLSEPVSVSRIISPATPKICFNMLRLLTEQTPFLDHIKSE